jgi:hypothetical protein
VPQKFCPKPTFPFEAAMKTRNEGNAVDEMNEGSIKGAIRIPLRSSPFLFNDVALRRVPCKSIESLLLLFSIPTAPTNHPSGRWALSKNTRGQKGQIRPLIRFRFFFSGTGDNRMHQFQRSNGNSSKPACANLTPRSD